MLSLIIPGKESVKCRNIDVYLQPLVEELELLWSGIPAYDISSSPGTGNFTLKAMFIWTIYEYPAYGLISGCATKGHQGCPVCGPFVDSRYSRALRKNLFLGHRCYLPQNILIEDSQRGSMDKGSCKMHFVKQGPQTSYNEQKVVLDG